MCIRYSYHNNATTEGIPHSPGLSLYGKYIIIDANAVLFGRTLLAAFGGSHAPGTRHVGTLLLSRLHG